MIKGREIKFVFSCLEKQSADFKIRLRHDEIQQTEFFCSIMKLYLSRDVDILKVVEKIKIQKRIGKNKIRHSSKEIERGTVMLKELALTDSEKESIFDIIETDLGDYE